MTDNKKHEVVKAMIDLEFSPGEDITEYQKNYKDSMKFPLSEVTALGVAFASIPESARTVTTTSSQAVQGLFSCRFPDGVSGQLAQKGSEYLGTIIQKGQKGFKQARWTPVNAVPTTTTVVTAFNPTTLFMAASLMNIEKKLTTIQATQQEILEFMEEDKKAKMKGDLNVLSEIMNNYKFNWDNERYKSTRHIKVLDIKQSAEHSITLYREQILKIIRRLNNKQFFIDDKNVKSKLAKIQGNFSDYQCAMYLYGFASFLDVMLLENFEEDYLNSIIIEIDNRSIEYRELYTDCYNLVENQLDSTVQSRMLKGLAGINKVAGKAIANAPIISKSPLDEALIAASIKLDTFGSKNTKEAMNHLEYNKDHYIHTFVEQINVINDLYNKPMEVILDHDDIYYHPIKDD